MQAPHSNAGTQSGADGQLSPKLTFRLKVCNEAERTSAMQRLMPFTTGSFVEVQFLRFADPSVVIHDGPHRAQSGRPKSWSDGLSCSVTRRLPVPGSGQASSVILETR